MKGLITYSDIFQMPWISQCILCAGVWVHRHILICINGFSKNSESHRSSSTIHTPWEKLLREYRQHYDSNFLYKITGIYLCKLFNREYRYELLLSQIFNCLKDATIKEKILIGSISKLYLQRFVLCAFILLVYSITVTSEIHMRRKDHYQQSIYIQQNIHFFIRSFKNDILFTCAAPQPCFTSTLILHRQILEQ